MTIGLVKGETLVAIKEEVTEGVAVPPADGNDYVQVLSDGLELSPAKELVERNILTSSIGKVSPRASLRSVSGAIPVEVRGAGVEGEAPQYEVLLNSALGNSVDIAARITSDTGHTTTTINKTAHGLVKGQMFVILEAGAYHTAFATDVSDPNVIVFAPAAASAPSDGVELSKSKTYYPANSGQPTFTTSVYWGDEIRERAVGSRINSLALENFTTGQIANFNFGMEGLSFDEADVSSPYAPIYQSGLPPLVLSAVVYQNGVCVDVNEFSMSVENTIAFLTSVKSADGRIASRIAERAISGSFNPYKDDTTTTNFNLFDQNTLFEVIITAQNPSAVDGEFELGSCYGVYLPNCLLTEKVVGDQDGILVENLSFSANRGEEGTEEEIFIGFV
jgi:hypothetical protein